MVAPAISLRKAEAGCDEVRSNGRPRRIGGGLRGTRNGRARNKSRGMARSMMALRESSDSATPHIPVLGREAVEFLIVRDGGIYIDGSYGAGGYTRLILAAAADARVIGIDRDQSAVARGADLVEAAKGRLTQVEDRVSNLDGVA